jgi:hypothetical protein
MIAESKIFSPTSIEFTGVISGAVDVEAIQQGRFRESYARIRRPATH